MPGMLYLSANATPVPFASAALLLLMATNSGANDDEF
jgi:hypothetical protein